MYFFEGEVREDLAKLQRRELHAAGGMQVGPIMGGGQEDSSHPDSASACP